MKKYTQKDVENVFNEQGYIVTGVYHDARTPIGYICPNGHHGKCSLDNFKRGKRCYECRLQEASERYRHDIEYVRKIFSDNGCVLLDTVYRNENQKQKYICSCGNVAEIRFSDFRCGERCFKCANNRRMNTRRSINNIACSTQQHYLHDLYGGEQNYIYGNLALDIAFPNERIYVEYDGSGHDLSVKRNGITRKEFNIKQRNRNYLLYRHGWKCFRIISRKDKLPTDDVLIDYFNKAKQMFADGMSHYELDVDNSTVEYHGIITNVDLGSLHRIRKDR